MISFTINGETQSFDGDLEIPLLWYLRDGLGLKGTKFGCGVGLCGICTVLIDGEANHACMVPVRRVVGKEVVTIEGLVEQNHPVLHAWIAEQVPQCGYCQPGQIMAAVALLNEYPNPDDTQINKAMSGVLCRCGTYQRIRRAIHSVAQTDFKDLPDIFQQYAVTTRPTNQTGVTLDEWIRIQDDGTVIIMINHSEMGQGSLTGLAMLVAEELDVGLDKVRTEFAPAAKIYRNPLFNEQTTGGSTSIRGEWQRLRLAGAKARWRLVQAAAQAWHVKSEECRTDHGVVCHDASNRHLGYGKLASEASQITPPKTLALKSASEFQLIGQSQSRLEIPAMVTAQSVYAADVTLPEMLVACVARRPTADAQLQAMDSSAAQAVPGFVDVIAITNGVAVLAENTWAAMQARQHLLVSWREHNHHDANNQAYHSQLIAAVENPGEVIKQRGDAKRALTHANNIIEATYETSFLAHATLEPMNCVAQINADRCDVWVGTQSQEGAQAMATHICGLPKQKINIHSTFLGGGFGRRLESDFVADAIELVEITNKPVQVLWSRADDFQHDFYRPAHVTVLKAVLDEQGWPTVWWQRSAGPDMALEMVDVPYDIANFSEKQITVESPLPIGAWRSVGAGQNAFVVESFIDELAHYAEIDPLEYRLKLLANAPRSRAVLELAAEKACWNLNLPEHHYQGIAQYRSFGSWVALVVELSVQENQIYTHRVVCAIDCGQSVNPDAICAQMEGAIAMGLSAALKEQVLFKDAKVIQTNFEEYPILTFSELPQIEVYIVQSNEPPGGVGEPGLPPLAPAVGNAIYAATKIRLRKLPFQLS
ncbi:molybdopterin cofactor-binding domain-containing protein [Kaarinaea lacus]